MDERVEKWTKWIDGPIKNGVIAVHFHRYIWREIGRIIEEHGDLPDSAFWQYHRDLYAVSQAVAVRRQADLHRDTASLARLLVEIRDDPQETYARVLDSPLGSRIRAICTASMGLDDGGRTGDHLDPAIPAADLERLLSAAANVKDYVDKHVAHADQRPVAAEASLTFGDLNDAIDVIGKLFQGYYTLFTAAAMTDLEPIMQHDWLAPFRIPWIEPSVEAD